MLSAAEQTASMAWLWKHMLARFGSQWTREYGEADGETADIWCESLADYTGAQLKRGVDGCVTWTGNFPPNLGQFAKLCLTPKSSAPEFPDPGPDPKLVDQSGLNRVKREQAAVNRMTTERNRRFVEAYYALGLHKRWGRLDPDKEAEYLARG